MPLPAALVNQVVYAVSKDETRYTLGGVYMQVGPEGLKLVATDGHRLAKYTARFASSGECGGRRCGGAVVGHRSVLGF